MNPWLRCFIAAVLLAATSAASASFHLFRIEQLYSNADGTVQFVVMHERPGSLPSIARRTGLGERSLRQDARELPAVMMNPIVDGPRHVMRYRRRDGTGFSQGAHHFPASLAAVASLIFWQRPTRSTSTLPDQPNVNNPEIAIMG